MNPGGVGLPRGRFQSAHGLIPSLALQQVFSSRFADVAKERDKGKKGEMRDASDYKF